MTIELDFARGPLAGRRDLQGQRIGGAGKKMSLAQVLAWGKKGSHVVTVLDDRLGPDEFMLGHEYDQFRIYGSREGLNRLGRRVAERGGRYDGGGALVTLR